MFFSSPFLFLLPITCEYIPDDYENTKFFLFLIILMILGFFCAYQQAALYGQASCFPTEKQMAAINLGMGWSGILMNIISGVIIFLYNQFGNSENQFMKTFIFYIFASIFLFLASFLYFIEKNNKFAKYYYEKIELLNNARPPIKIKQATKSILESCKQPSYLLFHLIQIYLLTMSVFPGVTNQISLTFLNRKGDYFQLFLIFLFNIGDTLGRYFAGKDQLQVSKNIFIIFCWIRVLFVVFFIFLAYQFKYDPDFLSGVVGDIVKISHLMVFAISNGYL